MAGTRFAMALAAVTDKFAITLLNAEPYAGYNRIMLSPVLAGEKSFDSTELYPVEDYQKYDICIKTNCTVTKVNIEQKQVITVDGDALSTEALAFDQLVFATGSKPFILPLPNNSAKGVFAFREKADVDAMLATVRHNIRQSSKCRCVVIGAGLLGLEAANALTNQGAEVTVVHGASTILNRQLDVTSAEMLQAHFEGKGVHFLVQAVTTEINVDANNVVTGLTLKDGRQIAADCIVMTVGVRPNISLAQSGDIPCDRGILVDCYMQTQVPSVYAIGECIQYENQLFGLVAPVYEQAGVLVKTLTGEPTPFEVKSTATKLKVSGVDLFSAGDIQDKEGQTHLIYKDVSRTVYKKLTLHHQRLVAAVLYGDVSDGAWFFELIQNHTDIGAVRQELLFGKAFCEARLAEAVG